MADYKDTIINISDNFSQNDVEPCIWVSFNLLVSNDNR